MLYLYFFLAGGYTTEWLGWESRSNKALDFAPAAQKAYQEFARAKYPELKEKLAAFRAKLAADAEAGVAAGVQL